MFDKFVFFQWGVTRLPNRSRVLRKLEDVRRLLPSLEHTTPHEQEALTTLLKHLTNRVTYRPDKHAPKEKP
jgi:hypothetical protein